MRVKIGLFVFFRRPRLSLHRSRRSLCTPPEGNMEKFCELSFLFDATLRGSFKNNSPLHLCISPPFLLLRSPACCKAPRERIYTAMEVEGLKKLSGVEEMTGEKEEFQIAVVGSLNFILMPKKRPFGKVSFQLQLHHNLECNALPKPKHMQVATFSFIHTHRVFPLGK